jgi:hypothetical protein
VYRWRPCARGLREAEIRGHAIGIFETLLDPKSLFLTSNTEVIYVSAWIDLEDGPLVVESPPNALGNVDDFWFR